MNETPCRSNICMRYTYLDSPIGQLLLAGRGSALELIEFPLGRRAHEHWRADLALFASACAQLRAYFAGELQHFELELMPHGTLFQRQVWSALRQIAYGQTCSYSEIARMISRPGASRAVGAANARNPLPIIVPCHRVIGANGQLTGFAGGVQTKRWLLEHEGALQGLPRQSELF